MPGTSEQSRPRLLLLDGHSLAYRAFFALPVENFATATGQHTNAVYGFTSMLVNVLRDEVPTHVAVAFDSRARPSGSSSTREYKAKRNKTPDEFSSQLPLIRRVLDALVDQPPRRSRATRPTTSSPPSSPRRSPRAWRC